MDRIIDMLDGSTKLDLVRVHLIFIKLFLGSMTNETASIYVSIGSTKTTIALIPVLPSTKREKKILLIQCNTFV